MGCANNKPKKFGDSPDRKQKVGEIKRRSQYGNDGQEIERRRSTAPKVTKIVKEEPVITKIEKKDSPKVVQSNAPVISDSAAPSAAQPERGVSQQRVEEFSVRKSEASEAGEDSNSDEIEGSDDGEPDKI